MDDASLDAGRISLSAFARHARLIREKPRHSHFAVKGDVGALQDGGRAGVCVDGLDASCRKCAGCVVVCDAGAIGIHADVLVFAGGRRGDFFGVQAADDDAGGGVAVRAKHNHLFAHGGRIPGG
ncbi:hypothetical protein D3C87_1251040 [compost metagenome]